VGADLAAAARQTCSAHPVVYAYLVPPALFTKTALLLVDTNLVSAAQFAGPPDFFVDARARPIALNTPVPRPEVNAVPALFMPNGPCSLERVFFPFDTVQPTRKTADIGGGLVQHLLHFLRPAGKARAARAWIFL